MSNDNLKQHTATDYKVRVCQAMNYISQNLGRELSLDEIAEAALFSKFHFHRIFKTVVGETVAGFTRRLRIEWAANRLLSSPQDDITKIALDCGFSSSQNFAKAFRQQFAMSPTEFRNSKNGNKLSKPANALSLQTIYDPETAFENHSSLERTNQMKAEIKELPERNVAYVRKMGAYGQETCGQAFGELMQWAGPRGLIGGGEMLGVYWDNPEVTAPEKCRTDACIGVPPGTETEGAVDLQTISGGLYAVCSFELVAEGFQQAWEDAFAWAVQCGHDCDDKPCYELYHNNAEEHPEKKWIFDICVPLKAKN